MSWSRDILFFLFFFVCSYLKMSELWTIINTILSVGLDLLILTPPISGEEKLIVMSMLWKNICISKKFQMKNADNPKNRISITNELKFGTKICINKFQLFSSNRWLTKNSQSIKKCEKFDLFPPISEFILHKTEKCREK